jgi:hypothetical protein
MVYIFSVNLVGSEVDHVGIAVSRQFENIKRAERINLEVFDRIFD